MSVSPPSTDAGPRPIRSSIHRGRRRHILIATVLALLAFAGFNLAVQRWVGPLRADFTAGRIYTLSDSARTVVGRLAEPVRLRLVYSRAAASAYPALRAHAARVRELLAELEARGHGKIRVEEGDPAPFSEEEDAALEAGLTPAPSDAPGDPVYLGVVGTNAIADRIAIPFLSPDRDALLEYDLVRLIAQLDNPKPPTIALLTSLPAFQGDGRGQGDALILREMARSFRVEQVPSDFASLPRNADVLVMIHPPPLTDWQQYQIDQFLMAKGRALIAIDPVSRVALASGVRGQQRSDLPSIVATLGVTLDGAAVADAALGLPVEVETGPGRRAVVTQPLFPGPPPALMSKDDVATADLSRPVNFGAPGRLVISPMRGLAATTLISTTSGATLVPADVAARGPGPREVATVGKPAAGEQALAVRIVGPLKSAYPLSRPSAPTGVAATPHLAASHAAANVVVVADTDVFDNGFYVNPQGGAPLADNAAFILNALDSLTGDAALVGLRSRAPAARPMTRVDDMRTVARHRYQAEEIALRDRLEAARKALDTLAGPGGAKALREAAGEGGGGDPIAKRRSEIVEVRARLRAVERSFRENVETLQNRLLLINVWLPPLLAAAAGFGVLVWRSRRRRGPA